MIDRENDTVLSRASLVVFLFPTCCISFVPGVRSCRPVRSQIVSQFRSAAVQRGAGLSAALRDHRSVSAAASSTTWLIPARYPRRPRGASPIRLWVSAIQARMDALMANYASDSDSDGVEPAAVTGGAPELPEASALLPPPPLDLLQPPGFVDYSAMPQGNRVRSFPHVEGNYALHVYIPVTIPSDARKQLALAMRRATSLVPDLYAIDTDYALSELCKDEQKLEKVLLSREFHVSLGRPVAVQVHQIDSFVAMLRQKFQSQQRYWMEFNKWEHFVNDDGTRSFLSLEVTRTGLAEISKQIHMVDEVYRLHGLPEFYKDPRPHISLVWALGDISSILKRAIKDIEKYQSSLSSFENRNVRCKLNRVVCKVGKKMYDLCKLGD